MQGLYQHKPAFPYNAGCEFSGVISSIPEGSDCPFEIGDRVFGAGQGAYVSDCSAVLLLLSWEV